MLSRCLLAGALLFGVAALGPRLPRVGSDDGERLITVDHYVAVQTQVPAIAGQTTQIYVREVVRPAAVLRERSLENRVVLFVHGAGTPAEVAFDAPAKDYSWMKFLAAANFDVFSMDMTGYGRSTRPAPMNDPCNLSAEQQQQFIPSVLAKPCAPSYRQNMTTLGSDWSDIGAVVDQIRALRRVEKIDLIGWSLGGPRTGGYTSQHPDKIRRLVLLAPAYNKSGAPGPPATLPAQGTAMNTQSHAEFNANWDRQTGCPNQYEPEVNEAVWTAMIESDPVGATWGTGVRRAPLVTSWGWNQAAAAKVQIPVLMVAGQFDKQVAPARVKDLYADLGSTRKVFVDLACSSHNALWERNRLLLFRASLEWLTSGTVEGKEQGMVRLGYPDSKSE